MRREDEIGKIEQGKAADLVLLDTALSCTPADRLSDTKVAMTLVDGEVIYEGGSSARG